ncbi:MAG: Holliday junction resolvase RuvX [Alphaproteobacteria bacterium]|nr:Holliday junction resolvase RuvX [Alphaproteobacteria bacterium]
MILPDFKGFPRTGRIIGLDWGARRTGVAVSDASREFVFVRPVIVTPRGDNSWARRVAELAGAENAKGIIIGMPVHSDGSPSEICDEIRAHAAQVCTYIDLPIAFIEENLTSVAAQESMGKVRRTDIKQRLDSEAARIILENAIALMRRSDV